MCANSERFRSWCFTINNYTEADIKELEVIQCKYIIYGFEVGENGTPHIQGYVSFKDAITMRSLSRRITRAHLDVARGSPDENYRYCSKQGNFKERGFIPKQGCRSDISSVKDIIHKGGGMREIIKITNSYQACRFGELALKYVERKRSWETIVIWYYGPTGTGKSRKAWDENPDAYGGNTGKWFDAYDADEVVILDDYRYDPTKISFDMLLRLTDRYPMKVQTKGGTREFLAKKIIFTSNVHPEVMFQNVKDENVNQFMRRINILQEFK